MTTSLFCLSSALLSPASFATPQAALDPGVVQRKPVDNAMLDFQLVNQIVGVDDEGNEAGVAIHGLYVAPHSQEDWGNSILDGVLEYGKSTKVTFDGNEETTCWDLAIMDKNDAYLTWTVGFDLAQAEKIVLKWEDGQGIATVTPGSAIGCE